MIMQIILLSLWCTSCRQWQIGKNFSFKKVFSDQYGAFFPVLFKFFTQNVFALPIKDFLKSDTLFKAVKNNVYGTPPLSLVLPTDLKWCRCANFKKVRTLRFDSESALRSLVVKKENSFLKKIKVHAEPYWKKSMAERTIAEIKIAYCNLMGFFMVSPPSPLCLENLKILYSF